MESVLVLNADFTPLNVTTLQKGVGLVFRGKAEILKESTNPIMSGFKKFARPVIIRLLKFINFRKGSVKLNRKRLFKRDHNSCVYCGSTKKLTIDHIHPKSRGGKNSWENLVTACLPCNLKKGDRTPEEAGMKMKSKPYTPNVISSVFNSELTEIYLDYMKSY